MSQTPEDPYADTDLQSPSYRERLRKKLDCLIAVLEVACNKVRRNMELRGSDRERMGRILANLSDTLATCQRARAALDRRERLPADLDRRLTRLANEADADDAADRDAVARTDFRDATERSRFAGRPSIDAADVRACDIDALARALQG